VLSSAATAASILVLNFGPPGMGHLPLVSVGCRFCRKSRARQPQPAPVPEDMATSHASRRYPRSGERGQVGDKATAGEKPSKYNRPPAVAPLIGRVWVARPHSGVSNQEGSANAASSLPLQPLKPPRFQRPSSRYQPRELAVPSWRAIHAAGAGGS